MLGNRQDIGPFCLTTLVPRLQNDKADAGIGEVGEIVERRQARYRNHSVYARRVKRDLGRLVERCRRAAERGAVGQLRCDHQITLVFVRNESGRQTGDAPDAQHREHQPDQYHQPADVHHAADQPGIAVLDAVVDVIE